MVFSLQVGKLEAMGATSSELLTDEGIFHLGFSSDWLPSGFLPCLDQSS